MENHKAHQDDSELARLKAVVPEAVLRALIDRAPDEMCSLIVQADLPKRIVEFSGPQTSECRGQKRSLSERRERILAELTANLQRIVGAKNTNTLKSSGSIIVNVPASKLPEISKLSGVKEIRRNRKLQRPHATKY